MLYFIRRTLLTWLGERPAKYKISRESRGTCGYNYRDKGSKVYLNNQGSIAVVIVILLNTYKNYT